MTVIFVTVTYDMISFISEINNLYTILKKSILQYNNNKKTIIK